MKQKPWATYTLLAIQIAVFVVMTLYYYHLTGQWDGTEQSKMLYLFGAELPVAITQGHEYWRLVTPIFIHIGWMHLFMNSITLYYVAPPLEKWLGHWKFILLYLLSGIGGNVCSLLLGNPWTISAGASTALFGLLASYFGLRFLHRNPCIQELSRQYAMFIVLNIVMNLFEKNVDILGHIGGMITGFILIFVLGRHLKMISE